MYLSDMIFGGALAFLVGVAAASLNLPIVIVMVIVATTGLAALFFFRALRFAKLFSFLLLFLFTGAFYYHLFMNIRRQGEIIPYGKVVTFFITITNEPKVYEKYQSSGAKLQPPLKGSINIITSPLGSYKYGDLLRVEGRIEPAQSAADKPTAAFPKTITIVAEHRGFWLKEKLLDFKNFLLSQFQKSLPPTEAALMGGLTLGSRADFSAEFKNQMKLSGTTHLVALSGYNIGILVWAVALVFGNFFSRRNTFYITLAVIFFFVIMVGAEASVVRAAVMGFLVLLAKESGRLYGPRNAITLTGFVMVLFDPTVLSFNVGFRLSFLSLLGIVYLSPALKKLFRIDKKNDSGAKDLAILTASAQLAVMPLIIIVFGQFSLAAILANVLILAFVPFTMFLGFLLAALSSIYFYLGFAAARLAEVMLFYEISVIKLFAKLSVPVTLPFQNYLLTAIYYFILALLIYYYSPKPKTKNEN